MPGRESGMALVAVLLLLTAMLTMAAALQLLALLGASGTVAFGVMTGRWAATAVVSAASHAVNTSSPSPLTVSVSA